jgi:3-phenylpropionate/trans-cinnamate dioxygenase ferredoxin subunit
VQSNAPVQNKKERAMGFVEVAKVNDIPAGTMKPFVAGGKGILVVNYDGKFYAIGRRCTHMGGDLSKGRLEGKIVQCPRHGSRFDVTTGVSVNGPKIGPLRLKTGDETSYEVRVEGDSIQVNV